MKATGWSSRTLDRKCSTHEIRWRSKKNAGGRGRPAREYDALSLPEEVRAKFAGFSESTELALSRQPLSNCTSLVTAQPDALAYRQPVSDDNKAQWSSRFELIKEFIDFLDHPPNQKPKPLLLGGKVICTHGQMAKHVASSKGISVATVWRLYKAWASSSLLRKVRSDKGKSRFFERYPKAAAAVRFIFLEQRQSIRCAHEALLRDREQLKVAVDEIPSYGTVRAFLQSMPHPVVTLAREGRRAYRERMAPYVSRDYDSVASNEIWVSDHMIHDVEVQNDCFLDAPVGTPIRLRFTALLDWHSRYLVGWSWAWEGSSRSITTALRNAVLRHGPAAMLYCDNGKDYLKVAKGAMPGYLRSEVEPAEWYAQELRQIEELGVLARLQMAVQHCIVRHPQSKHVERFFRTLHERFDKKFPTYTGGSPATRPDFTADAMAAHRKLLRMGRAEHSLHPPASVFMAMANEWIKEYQSRKHAGKSMRGRSPAEAFQQDRWTESRPVPEPRDLAILLMERERRGVRECAVTLNKRRYIGCDEIGRARLHELNECDVIIAYDPLDPNIAAILDLDGRLITMARPEILLPQSSEANGAIAESMKERRRLERQTAEKIIAVRTEARANGSISEVERLVRPLPMAVGDHITQRPARTRPNETAKAPATAAEIARMFLEEGES